ncbi:3-hydroxyacyl-ACP dehydratase FabZ family protein [Providencia burhodogranariea]|uniref:Fatty acyl chain dehydratase n=1 Tax=Providencia burhodogranariea DSM 19968 TaxID=1141662 RepID=K8WN01_9GAMM|nr:fatty acyl chain dehydratase [Providencia burhodogranariea DSM 19968]
MTNRYNNSLLTPSLFLKIGGWRQPIIMVDRIIDFIPGEKGSITIIKHVTYNDNYLLGHYPEDPVMPGIMIAEIFGQASEYFSFIDDFCSIYKKGKNVVLNCFSEVAQAIKQPESELILIEHRSRVEGVLVSQNLKFKNSVYPGDTIEVKSSLLLSDINNFKHYLVEARVGKKIIANGTIVNYREDIKFE